MIKPRAMLLGLGLAALAMAGAVPSASAVSLTPAAGLQSAAASPVSVIDGQACPDVMVIGARGTNQDPKNGNSLPAYTRDQNHGVGNEISTMYQDLKSANPNLVFSLEPVVYSTNVPSLTWFAKHVQTYVGYATTGAQNIIQEIQATDAACGTSVHYILAGYSLGAWAVHEALLPNKLTSDELKQISGVALFGDPEFIPFQPYDNGLLDTESGIANALTGNENIPTSLQPSTGSWCLLADPICQYGGLSDPVWQSEIALCATNNDTLCAHYQYASGGATAEAAAFLQPFLPPPTAPATPGNVTAVATSQYKIQVTWTEASTDVTGFNIDNGCPVGSCGPGATLAQTTGPVNTATFSVTPGSYQCFRVQAINNAGTSPWAGFGCISTPGIVLSATQKWTNTKVTVAAGDDIGITADGQISVSPTETVGPAGDPSCTPAQQYPGKAFPAPDLPCWSLIARIGNGTPFEVGTRSLITNAAAGVLFLGINDNSVSGNSGSWNVNIKLGGL
jgi:hypothetical protein